MANLLQSAQVEQISADSGIPSVSLHQRGLVLPRRWVVERTFSWFGRSRRLAKDYENLEDTLAAFITLACIQLAVRRLARP
jgi:transposase